jgi:hypothetical protein
MGLAGSSAALRRPAHWIRDVGDAGLDEDWTLVLLGVVVLVVTMGLAVLAAWTVHQRDTALQDATAAGQRLDIGGLDDRLYQNLIAMQQAEVALFQGRVDAAVQGTRLTDPYADLGLVDSDLAALKAQFGTSVRVQRDISLISGEMTSYFSTEAIAQDDNRQGLPVGAAYLRDASRYLTDDTLQTADDIRKVDEDQVSADDSAAAAVTWPLLVVAAISLACLVGVQILTARYTRSQFDPWLLLGTAATVIVVVWSVIALSVSLHEVGSDTSPHAVEAHALAQALVADVQDHNDDLLTLADHGEDCYASTSQNAPYVYTVKCRFETQVVDSLTALKGQLRADLALVSTDAPDRPVRAQIGIASAAATSWLAAENALPTLQNLAVAAKAKQEPAGSYPRYDPSFEKVLAPYTGPDTDSGTEVTNFASLFQRAVNTAIEHEWASYDRQAGSASGALTGAVTGAVLLGLLAAAAGGLGIALRVAEYWSAGRRPV